MLIQDSLKQIDQATSDISTTAIAMQSQIDGLNAKNAELLAAIGTASKYTPTVNPSVSLKSIPNCRKHAHIVAWFGNSSHTDVGYNSQSSDTIAWQMDQLVAKGIDGVNVLFSGVAKTFNTAAAQSLIAAADQRGLIISIMIDHEASVTADDFKFAQNVLMTSKNYWRFNGKRVLFVFDDPTAAQLATLQPDVMLMYRNSGGASKTQSGGAFGWPSPGNEASYCAYFYQQTAAAAKAGKLIVPHVSPGFLGASWNQSSTFKPTPWLYGQEWINSVNRVINSGTKPTDVMIATWNDHEEGTGIERTPLL